MAADGEYDLHRLQDEVARLRDQHQDELDAICRLQEERRQQQRALSQARRNTLEVNARLQQQQRSESRQQSTTKRLHLQLTLAKQLCEIAETMTQLPAAEEREWLPGALRSREQEVAALAKALKRQRQLAADAQQQLLQFTRRRRDAAIGSRAEETERLRVALTESELARAAAAARADQLEDQMRLLEQHGLSMQLHPPLGNSVGDGGSAEYCPATC